MRIEHLELVVLSAILAAPTLATAADSSRDARTSAHESGAASQAQTAIPFANLGGIYDWAADGDRGIYIQSINRQWYYARLFAPCINLPFAVRVGFVTEPGSGSFDRFSSILVRGQECPVASLTKSGPPPAKDHRWRGEGPRETARPEPSRGGGNSGASR